MAKRMKEPERQTRKVMITLTPAEYDKLVRSRGVFRPSTWARYLVICGMSTVAAPDLPEVA